MIQTQNKPWYVSRRGELLAEQFLLELAPRSLSQVQEGAFPCDYLATFAKKDGALIVVGVEVKATEREVRGRTQILPPSVVETIPKSNVPILFVVVDVKGNNIFFNWMESARKARHTRPSARGVAYSIPLREATPEERAKLRDEILARRVA